MKTTLLPLLILMISLFTSSNLLAAKPTQQAAKLDTQVRVTLDYLLYLPPDYKEKKAWPLVLFLHGGGERGNDLELVKMHGPPMLIEQGKHFPFIVVSPQCAKKDWWHPVELAALLDDLATKYKVDQDRVYVTGLSMGGFGSWALAAYAPDRIAAIVPICGGGEPFWTKRMPNVAAWVFHGAKDTGVLPKRSQEMVDKLKEQGGTVKFTLYPEAEHNAWTETYNNPAVYEWLLQQKRRPRKPAKE